VFTKGSSKENPIFNCLLAWDDEHLGQSEKLDRVVAVSACKWSFVPGELYSLRLKAYSKDDRIDLFGHGWDKRVLERVVYLGKALYVAVLSRNVPKLLNLRFAFSKPLNYLGPVVRKSLVVSRYKVALVIENDLSAMSEKLVDTILSGTIPVYVGPPVEPHGIPSELVVQCGPELNEIINGISLALTLDIDVFRRKALQWSALHESKLNWDPAEVDARLFKHIVHWYNQRSC
jgi:hypothetical protein